MVFVGWLESGTVRKMRNKILLVLSLAATFTLQAQQPRTMTDAELARLADLYRAELKARAAERMYEYQPTDRDYRPRIYRYDYRSDYYTFKPYRYDYQRENRYYPRYEPRTCLTMTYYQTCY